MSDGGAKLSRSGTVAAGAETIGTAAASRRAGLEWGMARVRFDDAASPVTTPQPAVATASAAAVSRRSRTVPASRSATASSRERKSATALSGLRPRMRPR